MGDLERLASSNGIPLSDIGRYRPAPAPQADMNGPIDPELLKFYLDRLGQQYPPLFPVNQAAWEAALNKMPESLNIEDRRGRLPLKKMSSIFNDALPPEDAQRKAQEMDTLRNAPQGRFIDAPGERLDRNALTPEQQMQLWLEQYYGNRQERT